MSDRGPTPPSSEAAAPFPEQPTASAPHPAPSAEPSTPLPARSPEPSAPHPASSAEPSTPHPASSAGPSTAPGQPFEINDRPFSLTGQDQDQIDQYGEADPARRPKSRVRRIVLLSLLGVGVAGAAALLFAGWQISSQKDATLTAPTRIGSLTLDESEDGKSTADYLQTALAAEVSLDKTVGAVYSDTAKNNVLFLGGTGLIWSPEKDLDTTFGLISDKQGAVTGLHKVDAGRLGGVMKCGTTKSDNGDLAVCGWSDHGSVALAMFPGHSENESAALLLQIRDAAEKRS